MEFREPEYFLWHGDHLEALLRAGRTDEVKARLDVLSKLANDGHRRWLMGVVARTEAQLLDGAAADARFEDAIRLHEALRMPFEVARTLLCRGQLHDRADARRLFLRLGATAWAEAALDSNVDAHDIGAPPRRANAPGAVRPLDVLSPSEREVALAVVSGHTNREIAAELHLSAKTVDHYLQRAYRKLGVKNRTELAITIARATAAPEWTRR